FWLNAVAACRGRSRQARTTTRTRAVLRTWLSLLAVLAKEVEVRFEIAFKILGKFQREIAGSVLERLADQDDTLHRLPDFALEDILDGLKDRQPRGDDPRPGRQRRGDEELASCGDGQSSSAGPRVYRARRSKTAARP